MKRLSLACLVLAASACAGAPRPAAVPPPPPPGASFEEKMAAILRLEDQRMLRDPQPPAPTPAPAPAPVRGRRAPAAPPAPPPPPPPPDLTRMLSDQEARIRRRAALAIGRVGLAEGVAPLVAILNDPEVEVRQVAAFALGLIGDKSAREPLGLVGDTAAAAAVGRLLGQIVQSGALAQTPGEEDDARRDTPAAAARLAIFALVRLKAYPQLAAAVLDASAQPRVKWWPVAFALQRLEDARALPALLTLARDQHPYARAFAVKGLGGLKDRSALPVLMPLLSSGERSVLIQTIRALGAIGDASAAEPLLKFIRDPQADPHVRLEAVTAAGTIHTQDINDTLLDLLSDSSPPVRAAALRSLSAA